MEDFDWMDEYDEYGEYSDDLADWETEQVYLDIAMGEFD